MTHKYPPAALGSCVTYALQTCRWKAGPDIPAGVEATEAPHAQQSNNKTHTHTRNCETINDQFLQNTHDHVPVTPLPSQ